MKYIEKIITIIVVLCLLGYTIISELLPEMERNFGSSDTLLLPSYDYLRETPYIIIEENGIKSNNIEYLYIPYSVTTMSANAIKDVQKIQCERDKKPDAWAEGWTNVTVSEDDWGVANG